MKKTTTPIKGKTISQLHSKSDAKTIIRNRIKARFAAMLKIGPEEYDTEKDFCTGSDVPQNVIGAFRQEFKNHILEVGKKDRRKYIWVADPAVAKAAVTDSLRPYSGEQ